MRACSYQALLAGPSLSSTADSPAAAIVRPSSDIVASIGAALSISSSGSAASRLSRAASM
jgi:hypothetical protein